MAQKETHGELPVGFRGEKQPSRDGAEDSDTIDGRRADYLRLWEAVAPSREIRFW